MSDDFFMTERTVKIRKARKCDGCLEDHPIGSEMIKNVGVFEGDFFSNYICPPCRKFIDENTEDYADGWCKGDIGRDRREREREADSGVAN